MKTVLIVGFAAYNRWHRTEIVNGDAREAIIFYIDPVLVMRGEKNKQKLHKLVLNCFIAELKKIFYRFNLQIFPSTCILMSLLLSLFFSDKHLMYLHSGNTFL